jgi:hypothetical protein
LSEESLFREVDEEVRREQLNKLWQRYGSVFVGLSIGIVVAVAGIKGWQYWERRQAEAAGSAYFTAVGLADDKKSAEALAAFEALAKGGHGGYAVLARFRVADVQAADGDTEAALKAYDALAADTSLDQALRDLARVRAAYVVADKASAADLAQRLSGLDAAGNPWRNVVNELIAVAAYRAGDYADADRRMNEVMADPGLSPGARQRAQIFLQVLQPLIAKPSGTQ